MKLSVITLALLATTPAFADTNIGATGDNVNIIGASTNISTSYTNISSAGALTINSPLSQFNGTIKSTGNVNVNGYITSGQGILTQGTGSITSAYSLSAASNQFVVAGDTGNVRTNGTLSAVMGSFEVATTGLTKANQGLAVNGAAGLTVGSSFSVAPTGVVTTNGINNSNKTITNLADGVNATDAVNVRQLNAEATARINGDVNTLNQANTYTNTQVNNAVGQANNYTDNRVNAETQRAMQAERELSNHINAVGAMAMAVGSMPRTAYNPDRKSRLNLGIGNYGNATAMAVGLSHDFNDRISGNLNVAQSITGNGNSGVGAGLSIGF
jgi:hypothetical protein